MTVILVARRPQRSVTTGGVDVFHACGIPANTYHPERFLLGESYNHQLTKVGGFMASAQPVS
jgi:hypothetical protein